MLCGTAIFVCQCRSWVIHVILDAARDLRFTPDRVRIAALRVPTLRTTDIECLVGPAPIGQASKRIQCNNAHLTIHP